MARPFELVLNAGPDRATAEQVAACLKDLPALPAGPHRVSVTPQPSIRVMRGDDGLGYQEVSVAAIGPGWVTTRTAWRSLQLTEDELTQLALGLYEALRRCDGYRAAVVGWDPDNLVDLGELAECWTEELSAGGSLPGLVLSQETITALGVTAEMERFSPGFFSMPYRPRP
jgi:hypothetical protein